MHRTCRYFQAIRAPRTLGATPLFRQATAHASCICVRRSSMAPIDWRRWCNGSIAAAARSR